MLTALQNELTHGRTHGASSKLSELFNKAYKCLHWVYFNFFFQLWQVKDLLLFQNYGQWNRSYIPLPRPCFRWSTNEVRHCWPVKLSSVCKGPPGFLNRHWEFWETRWQMHHRSTSHKTQRKSYKTFGEFNIFRSAGPDEIYLWVSQRNLPGQTV